MLFLKEYRKLTEDHWKTIVWCWIPSHIGAPENKAADRAAIKHDLDLPITKMHIHNEDYKFHNKELYRSTMAEAMGCKYRK